MKLVFLLCLILIFAPSVSASTANSLNLINEKVCNRFETDTLKLAAIMEEVRSRQGIKETRVAFGGIDTPIKSADYWVTFAAEAIAYQRAQKFSSSGQLRYNLEVLRDKILKAKEEVRKVLHEQG